jgi:hypothetical protein
MYRHRRWGLVGLSGCRIGVVIKARPRENAGSAGGLPVHVRNGLRLTRDGELRSRQSSRCLKRLGNGRFVVAAPAARGEGCPRRTRLSAEPAPRAKRSSQEAVGRSSGLGPVSVKRPQGQQPRVGKLGRLSMVGPGRANRLRRWTSRKDADATSSMLQTLTRLNLELPTGGDPDCKASLFRVVRRTGKQEGAAPCGNDERRRAAGR